MIRTIRIKDIDHPITFTNKVIGTWSHAMGISLVDFSTIGNNLDLYQATYLLFYALQEGYYKNGKQMPYTMDEVWQFTDEETGIIEKLFKLLAESRNVKIETADDEKKIPSH